MINVTKCFLPPLEEYAQQVNRAFKNEWLTNRGELVLELEDKLKEYLKTNNIIITNNGTVPLQIALKILASGGEVITTVQLCGYHGSDCMGKLYTGFCRYSSGVFNHR